jgi:ATP-grasp domain-containing protein
MSARIYYRKSLMEKEELEAAQKYFTCVDLISDLPVFGTEMEYNRPLVIPRYSLYPFYQDQEREIRNMGHDLINNYEQHRYIADLQNYVYDLKDLTPKTWTRLEDLPDQGPFILKGETNSRKNNWNRDMYAIDKKTAIEVHSRLMDDGLIGQQEIYIRQYEPMITFMTGLNGIPITKEFRFFVAYNQVISGGYYWQNYVDDLPSIPDPNEVPHSFLNDVIKRVNNQSNFFVIDVGQKVNGDWQVVELNDGCQSGLSCNDPNTLYQNLFKALAVS